MRKKFKLEQIGKIVSTENHVTIDWQNPSANSQRAKFLEENVGSEIIARYEIVKDAKSLAQLGFYWGALIPAMCKATGDMNKNRIHRYLKELFLMNTEVILGTVTHETPSLQDISRPEMSEFIDKCLNLLSDCGGDIDERAIDEYESVMLGDPNES